MDREKLKLIIKNLESLVECLKSEVYSDVDLYTQESTYEQIASYIDDYDEVFYDEDGEMLYEQVNKKYRITNDDGDGL